MSFSDTYSSTNNADGAVISSSSVWGLVSLPPGAWASKGPPSPPQSLHKPQGGGLEAGSRNKTNIFNATRTKVTRILVTRINSEVTRITKPAQEISASFYPILVVHLRHSKNTIHTRYFIFMQRTNKEYKSLLIVHTLIEVVVSLRSLQNRVLLLALSENLVFRVSRCVYVVTMSLPDWLPIPLALKVGAEHQQTKTDLICTRVKVSMISIISLVGTQVHPAICGAGHILYHLDNG